MHPRLQLTSAEQDFLQAWMWDEAHPSPVPTEGTAKRQQIDNSPYVAPLLVDIIAAAMSSEEQVTDANGPKPRRITSWPWKSEEELRARHEQAKKWLEDSRGLT